MPNMIFI